MIVSTGEYVFPWTLRERAVNSAYSSANTRAWSYRKKWTTLMTGGGKTAFRVKRLWGDWESEVAPFIDALKVAGFADPMPGSYAWPWTEKHSPPPTNPTLRVELADNRGLAVTRPRAWIEAVKKGTIPGRHYLYDLNSAYAWAAMKPLPDPRRVIYTNRVTSRPFGFYLVKTDLRSAIKPRRFHVDVDAHWMTKEELTSYDAHAVEVLKGCEWETGYDLRWQIDRVLSTYPRPMAKNILRAFWGGWSCDRGTDQFMLGTGNGEGGVKKMKALPSRQYCPVWSAHVLARVAARCADAGGSSIVHVMTDSILTTRELVTGTDIGDWKQADMIDDPWIGAAGIWGESREKLTKHAGRKAVADGDGLDSEGRRSGGCADETREQPAESTGDGRMVGCGGNGIRDAA